MYNLAESLKETQKTNNVFPHKASLEYITYDIIVGQISAKFRPNCSLSVKSMKFGTKTVFKMTKKIGYGGRSEIVVLPS